VAVRIEKDSFWGIFFKKAMGYKKNTYFCIQSILVAKQEVDKNDSK
jgi:hypothetical protein